jgi:hypothetical protein
MVVLAMFVNMVSIRGGFQCQQHEFAMISSEAVALVTNTFPIRIVSSIGMALIFVSKFLHFFIFRECSEEFPFKVVRCAENGWRICSRHQFLFPYSFGSYFYNFLY